MHFYNIYEWQYPTNKIIHVKLNAFKQATVNCIHLQALCVQQCFEIINVVSHVSLFQLAVFFPTQVRNLPVII